MMQTWTADEIKSFLSHARTLRPIVKDGITHFFLVINSIQDNFFFFLFSTRLSVCVLSTRIIILCAVRKKPDVMTGGIINNEKKRKKLISFIKTDHKLKDRMIYVQTTSFNYLTHTCIAIEETQNRCKILFFFSTIDVYRLESKRLFSSLP